MDEPLGRKQGGTHHRFEFHGTGKEFFGIWIVNVLLSIITIGIYSAWAKVRTKRYFNGNTELDGHRFGYHADPKKILIGRVIVIVVLVLINLISQLHPAAGLIVLLFYLIALPWVIVRGLAFNANMTSYRNVRFHFASTKWQAFKAFIAWPFAAIFTLGGLIPFASRASARFLGGGHFYGSAAFSADPPLKPYYKGLMWTLLVILGPALVGGIIAYVAGPGSLGIFQGVIILATIWVYVTMIIGFLIYAAYSRNNGFNHLNLEGGHRFTSTITPGRFTWIMVSNIILTLITLTLYAPWARVRLARYLADNTSMIANGPLDAFVDTATTDKGVTSGEFLDIEGFDFGF